MPHSETSRSPRPAPVEDNKDLFVPGGAEMLQKCPRMEKPRRERGNNGEGRLVEEGVAPGDHC